MKFDLAPDGSFDRAVRAVGHALASPEDLVPAMDAVLRDYHALGRGRLQWPPSPREPQPGQVSDAFHAVRRGKHYPANALIFESEPWLVLVRLYMSRMATLAAELDLPVAVHTGAPWTNWLDFRVWEPTGLIPFLQTFRDTRFDLYHAGVPFVTQSSLPAMPIPTSGSTSPGRTSSAAS